MTPRQRQKQITDAMKSPSYLGVIDPNDILNGRQKAAPGDTFISETDDSHGFVAFRYSPAKKAKMPHENFRTLAQGTRETCEAAVQPA